MSLPFGLNEQLISAADLNNYLVDKTTGAALAGGSVYFYQDINRTSLKPVYQLTQLSSNPPNYSYTAMPNPIILSGVGTIVDTNGNQVALYYYPYLGTPSAPTASLDLYYIEVYDANGLLQFTYEAWPSNSLGSSGGSGSGTINAALFNSVAYYSTSPSGNEISGIAPAANSILATTVASVPVLTKLVPSQVQLSVGSLNHGTSASSSTFWRGDGTWAAPSSVGPSFARAWAIVDTTAATAVINNSFNVTSATYNSVGNVTLTFTAAMPTASYVAAGMNGKGASAYGGSVTSITGPALGTTPTTTAYTYQTVGSTFGATESPYGQIVFFGS